MLWAHLVTHNESGRYFRQCLERLRALVDGIAVYDDASTDDTVELARLAGAEVETRPASEPAFLEHEGRFRQAAWRFLERSLAPSSPDWVLCVDADELTYARWPGRESIDRITAAAQANGIQGLVLPILEVFGWRAGMPLLRTDGHWGEISGCRLVAYERGGVFPDRAMASGSVPDYVQRTAPAEDLFLVHFGYATAEDRQAKHARYQDLPGHNPGHIRSILEPPTLECWTSPWP